MPFSISLINRFSDTLGCGSYATFLFLPHFDVICDQLLNRPTATAIVLYNDQKQYSIKSDTHTCGVPLGFSRICPSLDIFLSFKELVSLRTDQWFWIKKLISLIFWDYKASTWVVTKVHFVWTKMQNIFLYEFLNFWPVGTSAIAFGTRKIANIGGKTRVACTFQALR